MMTPPAVSVERRMGQRFTFNLPISLREYTTAAEGLGCTQDVSSRGVFFFTDMPLNAGAEIELTLKMPSEITLGETMRVRCKGRVLRIVKPLAHSADHEFRPEDRSLLTGSEQAELKSAEAKSAETRIGVAVCFNGYEYLPATEDASPDFRRVSVLHGTSDSDRPAILPTASPRTSIR